MKNRLICAAALLAITVGAWILPQPASAQLGSLLVNITDPASGQTVSGSVTVRAQVTVIGLITVAGVQFTVDGNNIGGEDGSAPYSVSWNTTGVANGSHQLRAVARSVLGLQVTSAPVTVTVNNAPPPDTTLPNVSITAPSNGATVSGTITISASASDNVGVAGVRFRIDGTNLGAEDTSAPYSISWNTAGVANGSHTVTAVARDAAGNTRTSGAVNVTVNNAPPPDTTPPSASITAPANGATVSGTITVTASASDNVGVAGVRFQLDGANLGAEDTTNPYSVSWNTTGVANGSHTLTAVARDAAGNTHTSATVTVTVNNAPPPDTTPPSASITSPANGATVSGTITISANASDNVGVAGVRFQLDGANLGAEDTSAPYSVSWNTTGAASGSHTLTAIARDAAGNTTTSASVTVTVSNGGPAVTRFEESNPAAIFDSNWVQRGQEVATFSEKTASSSNVSGATALFTFTGKAVSLIGLKCDVCGIATVSIDGGPPVTVDTASPAAPGQQGLKSETLFAASGLAPGTHTLTITVTGTSTSNGAHVIVDAFDVAGPSASVITVENMFPGSEDWRMERSSFRTADDGATGKQIKGYASATSVNKGESITFFITVTPAQNYTMDVYRMGWYQGRGGRLMQHINSQPGVLQPACPTDAATGLIECNWTPSHTLTVPPTWTSGVYLVQLTNALGFQNYITFVVRDDARSADILYQQPVTTYQAYNNYPDDGATGKSIYDFNSYGANTVVGSRRAVKVSWNRPYTGDGSGQFLTWEQSFVRWLERPGYDVVYSTNLDTHQNSERLLNSKAFLSVGHDEYWSKAMYDGVEQARDAGVSLGFFGANAVYWQVRFEPSPLTGAANRVMVGYKNRQVDPVQGPTTTVLWRDPFLNRPEQQLIGVQFSGQLAPNAPNAPYVVTNSSSWVYQGTGLLNGDSIPGIVGYEADSSMPSAPLPTSLPGTYEVLSQSPYTDVAGPQLIGNSSIYQAPSGAWVFGAGTISWSWGLDLPGIVDPRIQRTTENLLNRFLGVPLQP